MKESQERLLASTRRHFFSQCAVGLGQVALGSLLGNGQLSAAELPAVSNPLAPAPPRIG